MLRIKCKTNFSDSLSLFAINVCSQPFFVCLLVFSFIFFVCSIFCVLGHHFQRCDWKGFKQEAEKTGKQSGFRSSLD